MLNESISVFNGLVNTVESHPLASTLVAAAGFGLYYYWPRKNSQEDRAQDRDDRGYEDQKARADGLQAKLDAFQETYRKDILPLTKGIAEAHMKGAEAQKQVAGVLTIANNSNNSKLDMVAQILERVANKLDNVASEVKQGNERLQTLSDSMAEQMNKKARKR